MMELVYKGLDELKPYEKNPRINDGAVEYVANSIRSFGFKVPIVIDKHNVIVCGHTRWKASQQLGLDKVPCVIADDLSDEQIKAFRIADNKVAEKAEWDYDLLNEELDELTDFDMEDFGFEFFDEEEQHQENVEKAQDRVEDIVNLGKAQFVGEGKYDIPQLAPVYNLPEGIEEWIGFNYVLSDTNPENKAVHFFVDDYQFERVWNDPDRYIDKLSQYKCVLTPDFSPYGDMPLALQIYNLYRKNWCGCYWQMKGLTVIPTVRASTDPRSFDFYLDGQPRGGIVAISSMWATKTDELRDIFLEEYNRMYDALKPKKVILYGKMIDGLRGEIINLETFTSKRWNNQ